MSGAFPVIQPFTISYNTTAGLVDFEKRRRPDIDGDHQPLAGRPGAMARIVFVRKQAFQSAA